MITKKFWDTLSLETKKSILDIRWGNGWSSPNTSTRGLVYPYHHNFDFDLTGKRLKQTLECCYLQKDGTINVVVSVTPVESKIKFERVPEPVKKNSLAVAAKLGAQLQQSQLHRYDVDYTDKSGDLCHVWVVAYSKDDAKSKALHEYWDIKEIDQVRDRGVYETD